MNHTNEQLKESNSSQNETCNSNENPDVEPVPRSVSNSPINNRRRTSYRSPFFNFIRDFRESCKDRGYSSHRISQLGGKRWRAMSQLARAPYILEAAIVRRRGRRKSVEKRSDSTKTGSTRNKNSDPQRCPHCGQVRKHTPAGKSRRSHSSSRSGSNPSSKSSTSH